MSVAGISNENTICISSEITSKSEYNIDSNVNPLVSPISEPNPPYESPLCIEIACMQPYNSDDDNEIQITCPGFDEREKKIMRFSKYVRYSVLIKVILMLIYTLPMYYCLPVLIFEIIGYLSGRNLSIRLSVLYFSILVNEQFIIMKGIGLFAVLISDGQIKFLGINLIFQLVIFSVIFTFQVFAIPLHYKFYIALKGLRTDRRIEIINYLWNNY